MLTVKDPLLPAERGKCFVISPGAGCLEVVVYKF
jgi:hypothetical protein